MSSRTTPRCPTKRSHRSIAGSRTVVPKGTRSDLPPPANIAKGWGISEARPGLLHERQALHRAGRRRGAAIKIYVVDPGFKEDHWIQQAEVKAGNPAVVHHVIVFIQQPGGDRFRRSANGLCPRHDAAAAR